MPAICVTEPKSTSPIVTDKPYVAYLPAVIVAAGIAVLSLIEQTPAISAFPLNDKLMHGLMYAALSAALMGGCIAIRQTGWKVYCLTGCISAAYGLLMEVLQYFCTLTRSFETTDLLADITGTISVLLIIALWRRFTTSH
jgi:VanZ family protein